MAVIDSDHLSREDLHALLQERHQHCVSLYLDRALVGQATPADGIRLKNLIRQAEEGLMERGLRRPEAIAIMKPAADLVDESWRWQSSGKGLALFLCDDGAKRFSLPHAFGDLVIVNSRYHIEPLLPLINHDQHFYVLALARDEVRFYDATPHSMTQITVPDMPGSMKEALKYDEFSEHVGYYSNAGSQPGARQQKPMFYGQGAAKDYAKIETEGFFRLIDRAIIQALKLEKAPLVLACIDEQVPEYRNVNSYPYLMDQAITTGPKLLSADDLHHRAWQIVQPVLEKGQREAIDRFLEYAGTGRASHELAEIVPAAVFGRVESLMLRAGEHQWGSFDPETGEVQAHVEREPGDEDLIDVAASYALATRGEVFMLPPEMMPGEAAAAAVFRY